MNSFIHSSLCLMFAFNCLFCLHVLVLLIFVIPLALQYLCVIMCAAQVNSYPTVRGFTAIGTGGEDFVQAMVVAVESVIQQPIPQVCIHASYLITIVEPLIEIGKFNLFM